MQISKIEIEKYKTLENTLLELGTPISGSCVNLIAGINGCGKTSILDLIFNAFTSQIDQKNAKFKIYFDNNKILMHEPSMAQMSLIFNKDTGLQDSDINSTGMLPLYYNSKLNNNEQLLRLIYFPADIPSPMFQQQIHYAQIKNALGHKVVGASIMFMAENYIRDSILNNALNSNGATREDKINDAIQEFNKIFDGMDMVTELHGLSSSVEGNRPIFKTITGEDVYLPNLSSGEVLLYAKVATIMLMNPTNAIVLIDEPEMSFHPKWQRKIIKLYKNIPGNNQFILATHSPHILLSAYEDNIILMGKNKNKRKIEIEQFDKKPLSANINNVLKELMGAEFIDNSLKALQGDYRKLVEEGQETTENGLCIKNKILQHESEHSDFMQEMSFLAHLKKKK
jgi:predicted ATP-binding protein involved in virulence